MTKQRCTVNYSTGYCEHYLGFQDFRTETTSKRGDFSSPQGLEITLHSSLQVYSCQSYWHSLWVSFLSDSNSSLSQLPRLSNRQSSSPSLLSFYDQTSSFLGADADVAGVAAGCGPMWSVVPVGLPIWSRDARSCRNHIPRFCGAICTTTDGPGISIPEAEEAD